MNIYYKVKSAVLGAVVGDALGVPVEFSSRLERKADPVVSMRGYGTYGQIKGTWSDDSSMMFANMDSIINCNGIDYDDIMKRFNDWRLSGAYTPHGRCFDIGTTCARALANYRPGCDPLKCGMDKESDNGNGALMRILPAALYVSIKDDLWDTYIDSAYEIISNISSLTHRHIRSQMGCAFFASICHGLIFRRDDTLEMVLTRACSDVAVHYGFKSTDNLDELDNYYELGDIDRLKGLPESMIKSDSYVVNTLVAAVWCLLNGGSYEDCVLKAVNLGGDTDTIGALSGAMAGLWFTYNSIPKEWLDEIVLSDWINDLCDRFAESIS